VCSTAAATANATPSSLMLEENVKSAASKQRHDYGGGVHYSAG
jgi:hypothetical protein